MFKLQEIKINYKNGTVQRFDLNYDVIVFSGESNAGKSTLIDLIYKMIGSTSEKTLKSHEKVIQKNIDLIELKILKDDEIFIHMWEVNEGVFKIQNSEKTSSFPSKNNGIFKKTINQNSDVLKFPHYNKNSELTEYSITPYTISSFFRFNQKDAISSLISNKVGSITTRALEDVGMGKIYNRTMLKKHLRKWSLTLALKKNEQKKYENIFYQEEIEKIKKQIEREKKNTSDEDVVVGTFSSDMKKVKMWQRKLIINDLMTEEINKVDKIISSINKLKKEVSKMEISDEIEKTLDQQLNFFKRKVELSHIKTLSIKEENKQIDLKINDVLENLPLYKTNKMNKIIQLENRQKLTEERAVLDETIQDEIKRLRSELVEVKDEIKQSGYSDNNDFVEKINKQIRLYNNKYGLNLNELSENTHFGGYLNNGDTASSIILSAIMSVEIYDNFIKAFGEGFSPSLITWNRLVISPDEGKTREQLSNIYIYRICV